MRLREFLNEAAHPRRAWSGKLEKIDKLLAWMYEKDILSKGDQKRKDSIFNAYHRYYNDGDFPRILSTRGFNKYQDKTKIETALENIIDEFLKEMLTKYLPKVDRTTYRLDQTLTAIDSAIRWANNADDLYLTRFADKQLKLDDDSLVKLFLEKLSKESTDLKEVLDAVSPNTKSYTTGYRIEQMKEDPMKYGKITSDIAAKHDSVVKLCKKIGMLLGYMKETVEKVRDQRLLEK